MEENAQHLFGDQSSIGQALIITTNLNLRFWWTHARENLQATEKKKLNNA
jgi:hypothetical protein